VAGWHVYPGPQSVAVTHGMSHCGTQALTGPHVCPPSAVVMHSVPRSRSQAKAGAQSELVWQGSDMHVPAGPPSDARPADSHVYPIGQSEAWAHARASACRGSKAVAANAENARTQQACRVLIARPPSLWSVAATGSGAIGDEQCVKVAFVPHVEGGRTPIAWLAAGSVAVLTPAFALRARPRTRPSTSRVRWSTGRGPACRTCT
jgi:hypothetical protein